MKKYLIGGIIGAVLATGTTAFADSAITKIQAYLWPVSIQIHSNGQMSGTAPGGVEVLNYNNRAYVPLRFVTEQLGATVKYYNGGTYYNGFTANDRTITIDMADDRDLNIKDNDGIIGMGNFQFAHGNQTQMTVQVKQYKDLPADKPYIILSFYDSQGTLLLKQTLHQFNFEKGGVQMWYQLLNNNIQSVDPTKTKVEFSSTPVL
jgi:hypothetical protein